MAVRKQAKPRKATAAKKTKPRKTATKKTSANRPKARKTKTATKKTSARTSKKSPNYKKYPKNIKLYSGDTIPNPDAGCGPDMFLLNGKCKRKFDEEVLKILCPKVRLSKGSLNPSRMDKIMDEVGLQGTPFTEAEVRRLDAHCARLHEEVVDDMQSLGAQEAFIFGALKDLFTRMPMLMGKQVFDQLFGVIGYKTSKIAPGYVEIKKKVKNAAGAVSSVVKQIPFGAIGAGLSRFAKAAGSAAYSAGKYMAAQGFRAAKWVINSPQAQRMLMHLSKIIKHAICTAMGTLKDRKDMTWTDLTKEKFTTYKTDLFQLLESQAPAMGTAISGALVAATGGVGILAAPAVGLAVSGISSLVLSQAGKAGRLDDFLKTFVLNCSQFEYALTKDALIQRVLDMGIGTYGPTLMKLFGSIDLTQMSQLVTAA